jgi:hypothetical protein
MHTRTFAAIAAAVVVLGLAATLPAQAGIAANGFMMNGLKFNGLKYDGRDQTIRLDFNALKLHALVLPAGTQ